MTETVDDIAYRKLWHAVLMRQFYDAGSRTKSLRNERDAARHWLLHNQRDFALVCELAGYEPEYIRAKAYALAMTGWPIKENLSQRLGRRITVDAA